MTWYARENVALIPRPYPRSPSFILLHAWESASCLIAFLPLPRTTPTPWKLKCLVLMETIAFQASLLIPSTSKPCAWAQQHEKRMTAATVSMLMRPILWESVPPCRIPFSCLSCPQCSHGLLQVIGILLYIIYKIVNIVIKITGEILPSTGQDKNR